MTQADRVHSTPPVNTSSNNTSRRGFLTQAAAVTAGGAALGLALQLPGLAAEAVPDPVFAAIKAHRVADVRSRAVGADIHWAFSEWPPGQIRCPELPDELVDRMKDADEAERRAITALVDSRPATMEGAHALIDYLGTVIRDMDPRVW
jgi:hypothetical protein